MSRAADRPAQPSAGRGTVDGTESRALLGRTWGRAAGAIFTLFLLPAGFSVVGSGRPAWLVGVLLALLVLYGATYVLCIFRLWTAPPWAHAAATAVLLALATALVAAIGLGAATLYMYALAVASLLLPLRWAAAVDAVVLGGLFAAMARYDLANTWGNWVFMASITGTTLMVSVVLRTNRKLYDARHELAALAVSDERERVSRDLHDVLGHSLTTITVKAGLARRLLETDAADPARAIAEIADLERLSRQALTEVRATVSGYRTASLAAELAGARVALAAGEITADLPHAVDDVRADLQGPFAYVVREGVTNILRHSGARSCEIRLGPTWVEVHDDGRGGTPGRGSGLTGLRERLAAVGASLDAGSGPEGGFTLKAFATRGNLGESA